MDFTIDFFRDEVRNGFYIPTAIKQSWAASLTVLSEIDRICGKYGITYFADWGTILGAVRHGGFVPWDDDLDICMKRDDYIRFREVADAELPEEFVIHDYERKENHWLFLSRVVNNSKTCFTRKHLDKYHNFPYMCAVDIFIQDYLYKDEEEERARCEEVKRLIAVADGIVEGTLSQDTIERELAAIEEKYNTVIANGVGCMNREGMEHAGYDGADREDHADHREQMNSRDNTNDKMPVRNNVAIGVELYRLAEQQMARVPKEEAEYVGQIFPWILKGQKGLPKEYYEKIVRLPFENTTMPVPAYYDAILRSRYGNYLEIRKVWTGHDYPYFEKQREQLQAAADYKLPEFSFTGDMRKDLIERKRKRTHLKNLMNTKGMEKDFPERQKNTMPQQENGSVSIEELQSTFPENSYKNTITECMVQLCDMSEKLTTAYAEDDYEEMFALLSECQQLAVDMGTFIEEIKGEDRENVKLTVSAIQEYCDALYVLYQEITGEEHNIPDENGLNKDIVNDPVLNDNISKDNVSSGENKNNVGCSVPKNNASNDSAIKDNVSSENRGLESSNIIELKDRIHELRCVVIEQVLVRKEILFLPVGPKEWKGFDGIYNSIANQNGCDVYVVPLPVLFKDSLGRVNAGNEEIAAASREPDYPEKICITSWTAYDIKLHHPDQIYMQNPYDGENPCLTVPTQFYAKEIIGYTDELIYVPAFRVDEFHENDYNDVYNMKHYVTAPGVIYADRVIVQSENMKEQYVRKLTEFAGEDTRNIWDEKIRAGLPCEALYVTCSNVQNDASNPETNDRVNAAAVGELPQERMLGETDRSVKKKIFYCIGLNELSEHQDNLIESVKERFRIFEENSDSIDVTVALNPIDLHEWKKIDEKLADELFALIKTYAWKDDVQNGRSNNAEVMSLQESINNTEAVSSQGSIRQEQNGWCRLIEMRLSEYDDIVAEHNAYYGSASPLVPMFVHEKKPVMISGY